MISLSLWIYIFHHVMFFYSVSLVIFLVFASVGLSGLMVWYFSASPLCSHLFKLCLLSTASSLLPSSFLYSHSSTASLLLFSRPLSCTHTHRLLLFSSSPVLFLVLTFFDCFSSPLLLSSFLYSHSSTASLLLFSCPLSCTHLHRLLLSTLQG